ncbi:MULTISPECIES: anti-sigma factor [unclassified Caballeronia]|uniref:anti-sigma factor family protein n=1 Tax=unclassified Caballeronia TaxID=2646786 RepID=UPI00202971D4|nr:MULTISPECIES: hypothetical protein [unclassified Caballeronia]MDR5773487.1 hypothetical protein [Caballeronia sp. LZ002]MDR5848921.1 hypothetical protein [Caballeronia sp. LZ003]
MNPPSEMRLSEADVQAFADGVLASERTERLHAYLARRPDEARRVVFYDRLNVQLRSMYDVSHAQPASRRPTIDLRFRLLAAILGCFALMISAIWVTVRVPDEALERAAVEALSIDAPTATTPVPAAAAPDLSSLGFRANCIRNVTLGAFSTVSVITYRNALNEPLVLLSMRAPAASMRTPWQAHRIDAARLLEWTSTAGVRTVVGARAGTQGLMRAADLLAKQQNMQGNAS